MYLLHIHKNTLTIACIVCDEMVNDKLIEVFFPNTWREDCVVSPLKGDEDLSVTSPAPPRGGKTKGRR